MIRGPQQPPLGAEVIPDRVQDYYDLVLIKIGQLEQYYCRTSLYKATHITSNQYVILRRIHNFQPNPSVSKSLLTLVDTWKKVQCANVVRLLQALPTKAFGDNSLILVYQYFNPATAIRLQYLNYPSPTYGGPGPSYIPSGGPPLMYGAGANRPYSQQNALIKNKLLPETLIWHYVIQISAALRMIHSLGLACRVVRDSKIIITATLPKCAPSQLSPSQYPRLRINGCGMLDMLSPDQSTRENPEELKAFYLEQQQEDLCAFGQIFLSLASCSPNYIIEEQLEQALDFVSRNYSNDLRVLIVTLLSTKQQNPPTKINDIMPIIGARFYTQLNLAYESLDARQAEFEREMLNGRLFRTIVKLNMINERPELRMDPHWSETGDRYMLKLFRDFLFHQLDENGTPWLDIAHVVSNLCKFDMGSPEKICLISRGEQHVFVVSFAELKRCFEKAFSELMGVN